MDATQLPTCLLTLLALTSVVVSALILLLGLAFLCSAVLSDRQIVYTHLSMVTIVP